MFLTERVWTIVLIADIECLLSTSSFGQQFNKVRALGFLTCLSTTIEEHMTSVSCSCIMAVCEDVMFFCLLIWFTKGIKMGPTSRRIESVLKPHLVLPLTCDIHKAMSTSQKTILCHYDCCRKSFPPLTPTSVVGRHRWSLVQCSHCYRRRTNLGGWDQWCKPQDDCRMFYDRGSFTLLTPTSAVGDRLVDRRSNCYYRRANLGGGRALGGVPMCHRAHVAYIVSPLSLVLTCSHVTVYILYQVTCFEDFFSVVCECDKGGKDPIV